MKIEYQYGFCEPAHSPIDAAVKARKALVHGGPCFTGGMVQSQANPGSFSACVYEWNAAREKCFVARIYGTEAEVLEACANC